MAVTNPGPVAYDDYATQELTQYLKSNTCTQAPKILGNLLQDQCASLLDQNQSEIKRFISANTKRQNFIVFSIYKTDLAISELRSVVPAYHFESVGIFQRFFVYKVEKLRG